MSFCGPETTFQKHSDQTSQFERKSILNIHWKDWCWSWSSDTLATWCEELTHWKKTLMLGKTEGNRRKEQQRMRWLDSIVNSVDMSLSKLWEMVKDREACHISVHGVPKSQTWLRDWTTTIQEATSPICSKIVLAFPSTVECLFPGTLSSIRFISHLGR